ncbi:MAG: hypothetical protein JXA68_07730 [Ignavibacteriales bacterium]|nr:hypothetical protein [Ignavibacteriales bacterium]
MENNFKNQKSIYFSLLIAIGCFWGFTEFLIGTALKEQIPNNAIGSILIGLSFFFLAVSILLRKKLIDVIIPLGICIILKLVGTILIGKSIFNSSIVNPIVALILEAGIFVLLYLIFFNKGNISLSKKMLIGAAAGLLVSFLFPLLQHATQLPICIKAGTTTPLSIYYAPISIVIGAIALPAGIYLNKSLKNFVHSRQLIPISLGLNLFSIVLVILSFLITN